MQRPTRLFLRDFHAGDAILFGRLVHDHGDELRRSVARFTHDADEIDELVSATWAIAWIKREQFTGRGPVIGWLARICRSVAIRTERYDQRHERLSQVVELGNRCEKNAEYSLERDDLEDVCLNAVMMLPERRRLVVICRVLRGLSVEETAKLMHCKPGTVKATLHAALAILRASVHHEPTPANR